TEDHQLDHFQMAITDKEKQRGQ
ncbi:hypothetical protein VCHC17A1_2332B, partial [Vibrio cholerae HC-17A1]